MFSDILSFQGEDVEIRHRSEFHAWTVYISLDCRDRDIVLVRVEFVGIQGERYPVRPGSPGHLGVGHSSGKIPTPIYLNSHVEDRRFDFPHNIRPDREIGLPGDEEQVTDLPIGYGIQGDEGMFLAFCRDG